MYYGKICDNIIDIIDIEENKNTDDKFIIYKLENEIYPLLNIVSGDCKSMEKYLSFSTIKFLDRYNIKIKDYTQLKNAIRKLVSEYISGTFLENVKNYVTVNEYFKNPDSLIDYFANFKEIMKPNR